LEAYEELLALPKTRTILPGLLKRLHRSAAEAESYWENWGIAPNPRYGINFINCLVQSARALFVFWEWNMTEYAEYGVIVENVSTGKRTLAARGLPALGELWLEIEPEQRYVTELVAWNREGRFQSLLRSGVALAPRDGVSGDRSLHFVDGAEFLHYKRMGRAGVLAAVRWGGGSSAMEWVPDVELSPARLPQPEEISTDSSFQRPGSLPSSHRPRKK
jgi:hypothetical protein